MTLTQHRRKLLLPLALLGMGAWAQNTARPDSPKMAADLDLNRLKGKVIYVDFWASWCGPCRQSFPWMNAMQDKYGKDGLVIVAVNVDQDVAKAQAFLAQNPARFDIRYDPKGTLAEQFAVKSMPSSFILDRRGKTMAKHAGFHLKDIAVYEGDIQKALSQPA